jgi:hypothetical protein
VIATEDQELAVTIAEELQVDLSWEKGDEVLLDNYAVMHSSRPWVDKRVVLAALWDDVGATRIGGFKEGRKILDSRSHPVAARIP